MEATKVGIREFRAGLTDYIAASTPVAITRHGQTVGYFVPAQPYSEAEMAILKQAGDALDALFIKENVDTEAMFAKLAEFDLARAQAT